MNKPADRPAHRSTEANAEQPIRVPHPLEDLSGIRMHTKRIPMEISAVKAGFNRSSFKLVPYPGMRMDSR